MPKILIISATIINYGDDRGGVDAAEGDMPEVTKETALALVRANRALYTDRKDDPDKAGSNTASARMIKAAEDMAKEKAKAAANPPA